MPQRPQSRSRSPVKAAPNAEAPAQPQRPQSRSRSPLRVAPNAEAPAQPQRPQSRSRSPLRSAPNAEAPAEPVAQEANAEAGPAAVKAGVASSDILARQKASTESNEVVIIDDTDGVSLDPATQHAPPPISSASSTTAPLDFDGDESITLQIMQITGEEVATLEAQLRWTCGEVKAQLVETAMTPARYIRLVHEGKELEDDRATLGGLGLTSDDSLTLVRDMPHIASLLSIGEDEPLLVTYLVSSSADLDETDEQGWTALHWAAHRGFPAVVEALLDLEEFEVDAQDMGRMTALHTAAARGHTEICEMIANHPKFTLLNARAANGNTALHWAARQGHAAVCLMLLEMEWFDAINDQNTKGWTALHYAASAGMAPVCQALLERRDFQAANEQTMNGETALHWAALNGHVAVCEMLVDHIDVHATDCDGFAALDEAIASKNKEIHDLIQRKIDCLEEEKVAPLPALGPVVHKANSVLDGLRGLDLDFGRLL
eukprot:TRINITY_DN4391_c0_g1_i1.p1 TRINITY_DN4391_c0_g1~~TRINITY_DN4391_c0_g1_i1.p1  ORF type:complete len:489 (-),score=88.88 TRINITY_DN4391_c0_g1_i1:316-1782(-)